MKVPQGLQLMQVQDGGIEEAIRRAGVHQGLNWDRKAARYKKVDQERKVTGKGGGERGGRGGNNRSWTLECKIYNVMQTIRSVRGHPVCAARFKAKISFPGFRNF